MQNKLVRTQQVAVLACNGAVATTIVGPQDVFSMTGVLYEMTQCLDPTHYFRVQIVTADGKPVRCYNNLLITPDCSIRECDPDIVVVPAVLDLEKVLQQHGDIVPWLQELYSNQRSLVAVCSGSLLLAATGLLDDKIATTHWAMANLFRKHFPKVRLRPDEIITDDSGIICSGGYDSYLDVCIYVIEKCFGAAVALQCSKIFVKSMGQRSQAPYTIFTPPRDHGDEQILHVQQTISSEYDKNFDFDKLAQESGMSRRTLERRFKKATGMSPLIYQQRTRVERAKTLLESSSASFDEISYRVGYMDNSFFRKLFIKYTTLRPREYRTLFA